MTKCCSLQLDIRWQQEMLIFAARCSGECNVCSEPHSKRTTHSISGHKPTFCSEEHSSSNCTCPVEPSLRSGNLRHAFQLAQQSPCWICDNSKLAQLCLQWCSGTVADSKQHQVPALGTAPEPAYHPAPTAQPNCPPPKHLQAGHHCWQQPPHVRPGPRRLWG